MKTTLITLAMTILLGGSGLAQRDDSSCQLELVIPQHFDKEEYRDNELLYQHRKYRTAIILSKSSKDEIPMNGVKSAALAKYDVVASETACDAQTVQQKEIGGNFYYLVSWVDRFENESEFYHLVAYTESCDSVYAIELSTEEKVEEKMLGVFLDMLEACSLAYVD